MDNIKEVHYPELEEWILSFSNELDYFNDQELIYDTCINMKDNEVVEFTLNNSTHTFKVTCIPDDEELIFDVEKIA